MKVTLCKAYPASSHPDDAVAPLEIAVTDEVPHHATIDDARAFYREQARALASALRVTLPGGTFDALLLEILERKVVLLRVRA